MTRYYWQFILFISLVFSLSGCFSRPDLNRYQEYFPLSQAIQAQDVSVTYLGTTTLLFSDGDTQLMIDGFFTRPGNPLTMALGPIQTDQKVLKETLHKLKLETLDAVLVFHSHYDHAMDSAQLALETGADVLGSESTANIMRGAALPEARIRVVQPHEPYAYGNFKVTFIPSVHVPLPPPLVWAGIMDDIEAPLSQPTHALNYKEGETYAILIEHPQGRAMLHSGDFDPGELRGYQVDAMFQCTPGLPGMSPEKRAAYFQEILVDTQVKTLYPVHWDDFSLPLSEPLVALPHFPENLDTSMDLLIEQAQKHQIKIQFLRGWDKVPLFK